MATAFTFVSHIGADGTGGRVQDATNPTFTASVDDGSVQVGDAGSFTGLGGLVQTTSGINNGDTVYYHGTGVFDGVTGYVFSEDAVLTNPSAIIVVFDTDVTIGLPAEDIAVNNFAQDTSSQTLGTDLACFAAGTLIATPNGEVAVEDLTIGDAVTTTSGQIVPVRWIGRQTVNTLFSGPKMQPVRIRAGALGDGLPHTDLVLTADHAMIVDGLAINAGALVNGTSIDWVPMDELPDRVTYYHIETENHDVILANGAPAETFIDYAGRQAFDNYAEYVELFGGERIIPEMDLPRISARRLVPEAIKRRLGIVEPQIDWDAPLSA